MTSGRTNWIVSWGRAARQLGALLLCLVPLVGCSRGDSKLAPYANASARTADEWAQLDAEFETMVTGYDKETGATSITVAELQARPAAGDPVVLLDTRDAFEFNAAHLPDARLTPPGELDSATLDNIPEGAIVVTYCTAGLRSGHAAVQLANTRGLETRNLHGGIVSWFNAGGTVVDKDGKTVNHVHPYGPTWGKHVHPRD